MNCNKIEIRAKGKMMPRIAVKLSSSEALERRILFHESPMTGLHFNGKSAAPATVIDLGSDPSVAAGSPVAVRFFANSGFSQVVQAGIASSLKVRVPFYVSPKKPGINKGKVHAEVLDADGMSHPVQGSLMIKKPGVTGAPTGEVTLRFLTTVLDELKQAEDLIDDSSRPQGMDIEQERGRLQSIEHGIEDQRRSIIDYLFEGKKAYVLGTFNSGSKPIELALNRIAISTTDRILASFIDGLTMDGTTGNSLPPKTLISSPGPASVRRTESQAKHPRYDFGVSNVFDVAQQVNTVVSDIAGTVLFASTIVGATGFGAPFAAGTAAAAGSLAAGVFAGTTLLPLAYAGVIKLTTGEGPSPDELRVFLGQQSAQFILGAELGPASGWVDSKLGITEWIAEKAIPPSNPDTIPPESDEDPVTEPTPEDEIPPTEPPVISPDPDDPPVTTPAPSVYFPQGYTRWVGSLETPGFYASFETRVTVAEGLITYLYCAIQGGIYDASGYVSPSGIVIEARSGSTVWQIRGSASGDYLSGTFDYTNGAEHPSLVHGELKAYRDINATDPNYSVPR